MSTFTVGQIVKIVLADGSTYRVGVVVVPQFEHSVRGTCVGVRTAANVVAFQEFDPVQVDRVQMATADELKEDIERERMSVMARMNTFGSSVSAAPVTQEN